uniref:Reprolysin n=1 Tax=Rhipicephalus appendiculatus TaxID=34631 RepID=A0A131Z4X4_RHIAP
MSYVDGGPKHHRFSHCSLRQIRNVIIMRGRSCWTVSNTAHTNQGKYPGMEVAPNAFCKNVFPDKANVTADMNSPRMRECMVKCQYAEYSEVCYYGRCRTYVKTYFTYEHALDYMYCGERQVCVQGVCGGKPVTLPPRPTEAPATQESETTGTPTPSTRTASTECRCDCSTPVSSSTVYGARPTTPRRTNSRWWYGKNKYTR